MSKRIKMDWSTIKLLSGIIVAVFTVIGLYAAWKDSQYSKKSTKEYNTVANQKREEIGVKIEEGSEKLGEMKKALNNLDYIGMTSVQDLKDRYPYGYVLFGKLENRLLHNGTSIRDNSLNFSADWEKTELSYDASKDPYHYYLTLYDIFHSNHTEKNAIGYKGFNAPKSKVNVPLYKDQTPVDITFIKYYDEPHMYYEILENFDGEDMVFLLGFKKNAEYDENYRKEHPEAQKGVVTNEQEVKKNFNWNKEKFPENYKDKQLYLRKEIEIDLNDILISDGAELKKKYPYGFILFGNYDQKMIVGNRINDESMRYDANWKNIWLRPGLNKNYILSIPDLIQKGVPDPKTGRTPLIAMQLLETEVPSKKSETPIDITQVVTLDQPHLYFEILKEFDGKNMLFLIGSRKDKDYDQDPNNPGIKIGN